MKIRKEIRKAKNISESDKQKFPVSKNYYLTYFLIFLAFIFTLGGFMTMPSTTDVASVVPDYALACQSNGGQWLAEFKECELFESHEFCEELGGVYNECASACRNAPDYPNLACIDVCVEVCSFR